MSRTLWAVSDLHVTFAQNQKTVDALQPHNPGDWLIVAGDVAEKIPDVVRVLSGLAARFDTVIWVPGNHELFNRKTDRINGKARYRALVGQLRALGVITPEDPYPVFGGVTICPLFTLYDYSFRPLGFTAKQAVAQAKVKLDDELAIAPYVDIPQWCAERLSYTEDRLKATKGPKVLVNHWPLVIEPTHRLFEKDIALWCGTTATRDWAVRFNAVMAIHGHLHIPAETRVDGISHVEVSLGYPFEKHPPHLKRPWPFPVMQIN
ncbi:serine/threonine-specific protein phosphatase [Corynebacterium suranareeae]|uniref:Serine/threonine-specific protein phosphatase n=1 Tax=Corynebacterium suranareeae TaxID=2506452 RepID=A0A161JPN3_9CORY|nr:metallophosphoesterase [Corynebacterium suranareeae]BAU97286.1 serine/threonine-specific protein phosphatase [Corynebacterium suranareeae]